MWWVAGAAWGQTPALGEAELLDPVERRFGERPPAVGPRRALAHEAAAALLQTRAGAEVDPSASLALREQRLEAALRVRTRATARGATADEELALAWVLDDLGRRADAHWERALALEPAGPYAATAHLALAEAHLADGRPALALRHLSEAALDPAAGAYASWRAGRVEVSLGHLDAAADWFVAAAAGPDPVLAEDVRRDALHLASKLEPGAAELLRARVCGAGSECR
jgi:tetratricopeptide (TPR) repeat protein